jgi:hypothetical protein
MSDFAIRSGCDMLVSVLSPCWQASIGRSCYIWHLNTTPFLLQSSLCSILYPRVLQTHTHTVCRHLCHARRIYHACNVLCNWAASKHLLLSLHHTYEQQRTATFDTTIIYYVSVGFILFYSFAYRWIHRKHKTKYKDLYMWRSSCWWRIQSWHYHSNHKYSVKIIKVTFNIGNSEWGVCFFRFWHIMLDITSLYFANNTHRPACTHKGILETPTWR